MFNNLINAARQLLSKVLGTKPAAPAKNVVINKPVQPMKPAAFAPLAKTFEIANTWVNPNSSAAQQAAARASIAQTTANNQRIAAENARKAAEFAAAEAKRKADAQAAVWKTINTVKSTLKGVFSADSKKSPVSQNNKMVIVRPETKRFAPIAPLAPVPVLPTPVWKDKSGQWHGNSSDIAAYEKDIDRYNTEWKDYVEKRFKYSDDLFAYNQQKAEDASNKANSEEATKLWGAKVQDKKANIWGQIGNFFTGGKTQEYRDNIKNNIEKENKELASNADIANNQLKMENERWLKILQTKLDDGDVDGFNSEFDKYDKYMTSSLSSLTDTQYKAWGKQQAQQSFLNGSKQTGLITAAKDAGTWALGTALDVLDLPRRGVNTVWNMVDPTRTRTYYDGSVKTDKITDWGKAWNESYNQNVVSTHQKLEYNAAEAKKKYRNDYVNYSNAQGKKTAAFNTDMQPKLWKSDTIPAGLSEEEYYKEKWRIEEDKATRWSQVQDFAADPTLVASFAKAPLKEVGKSIAQKALWRKTGGLVISKVKGFAKNAIQSVTKNPKVASAIIGARVGKIGQAVDWLTKPSTATAKGRWENNLAVQRALQGRELAKQELEEIVDKKWKMTFNKQLELLPSKIKDVTGKSVRFEAVDLLKTKLSKMTKTQSRAFNHYVQAEWSKTTKKMISPAYSWAGKEKYWQKLSRADRKVVANLATSYKAVTDKLYSIDRATARRGFSKVPKSIQTYTGGIYAGAKDQAMRPLVEYSKKQGYIAKQFKHKSWAQKLEKMKEAIRPKQLNKWDILQRKDPSFTQHKKLPFSQQSGAEISQSLDKRIAGSRRAWAETIPETYTRKTQGKLLQGYSQNPNQRWIGKGGTLDNRFNPEIKLRSGIKGYEADLADLAASREFKKGGWEKVMEVAGLPKRVWSQSVTRFRPAWYLNNIAYNVPASFGAAGTKAAGSYGDILKAAIKEKTLTPAILRELPKEVTNMSAKFGTLGTKVENISRGAAYLAMRDAGVPKAEALKRLNDWLFDYAKTANWERPLKTVMPFWSFHKGLAMLSIKMPIKYPGASFLIASFKREFMDKPLAQIPDEEVTWTDPITGEEVKINKQDLYRGKMKVPFTENTWINTPFFPFGDSKISLHPILDLFEEHKSGRDSFGRDTTDKDFWRKAVARIPQLEIVARAWENSDQKSSPEKYIQRWVSENGTTKWAQGYDPSATNYKKELDNSKRFWDNARSFFGIPNTYEYDYEDQDYKTRMAEFQREYFAKNWDSMDWDTRDKEQNALAKAHGFTLDDVYKNWARYDTPASTAIKEQKQEARDISKQFWSDYFSKDKGQQYIKDVQDGKKSERAAFLREYLVKQLASGGFADNRFLIGGGTVKKALMSLAQDVAYSEVKTQRFLSVNAAKVRKASGDTPYVWRGKTISVPQSEKASIVKRAVASGDWTEYRKKYGETKPRELTATQKFWKDYISATKSVRLQMMSDNPQYNKRKDWTAAQWEDQNTKDRMELRRKVSLVAGDKVSAYKAAAVPKTARSLAWRNKNSHRKVVWKK